MCLYVEYITEDEITEEYGRMHFLLEEGFKYEIGNFTYYDVWDH